MISKFVIAKLISNDKDLLKKVDVEYQEVLENLNVNTLNEELWNIRFDLKAD